MKKYFVLALALIAFAVAPVMADVAISGEYDMSGVWNAGDKQYAGTTDKMELDIKAALDDFNTFKYELEDDKTETANKTSILDEPLTINYVEVITDWGKYFGFADKGFNVVTTVGMDDFGYAELVDFTGYELEYSDFAFLGKGDAVKFDFDIMGIVKPYYAMHLDTFGEGTTDSSNGASWIIGSVVDLASVAPVSFDVYYMSAGDLTTNDGKQELNKMFGFEVLYSGEVADGVELTAGGFVNMAYTEYDEFDTTWGAAVAGSAYNATVSLGMRGYFLGSDAADVADGSYGLSLLSVEAGYDVIEWLGLEGGMLFALGDYATDAVADETFLGAEFGVYVKPGKGAKYSFGYVTVNEDAIFKGEDVAYSSVTGDITKTPNALTDKGGLYFKVNVDY